MALILNIDTALDTALVSIADNGVVLYELTNPDQRDHSAFLHPAIQTLIGKTQHILNEIDAIAVSAGPGSYTGLRVALATAKGLCFALNKPLIMIGTLEIMAAGAIMQYEESQGESDLLYCPMIDARRMEVFTAIYDSNLKPILAAQAKILSEDTFGKCLLKNKICFFGNGSTKWEALCKDSNAKFLTPNSNALAMSKLSFERYQTNSFADTAYSEPLYIKEFYSGPTAI